MEIELSLALSLYETRYRTAYKSVLIAFEKKMKERERSPYNNIYLLICLTER